MATDRAEAYHATVTAALDEERAATLGRASRRLEAARERAWQADASLRRGDGDRAELLDDYRAARREMEHWRWVMQVQREAIGLYDHTWVDRVYPPLRSR